MREAFLAWRDCTFLHPVLRYSPLMLSRPVHPVLTGAPGAGDRRSMTQIHDPVPWFEKPSPPRVPNTHLDWKSSTRPANLTPLDSAGWCGSIHALTICVLFLYAVHIDLRQTQRRVLRCMPEHSPFALTLMLFYPYEPARH